jgi:hypothetical protein
VLRVKRLSLNGWRRIEHAIDKALGDRCLSQAEMKAQGARCECKGLDDYCVCQNTRQT